jgi:hypothetical protein
MAASLHQLISEVIIQPEIRTNELRTSVAQIPVTRDREAA